MGQSHEGWPTFITWGSKIKFTFFPLKTISKYRISINISIDSQIRSRHCLFLLLWTATYAISRSLGCNDDTNVTLEISYVITVFTIMGI